MKEGVITSRLDLLIALWDTTTGMPVTEKDLRFFKNGERIRPDSRESGNYILINQGREDGPMQILAYGYEPFFAEIRYEEMDRQMPTLDAFLIPSESGPQGGRMLSLSGQCKGITSIEAIHLGRPITAFREYDKKRRTLSTYMPNRRMSLDRTYYGIADTKEGIFEKILVLREVSDKKVRIKDPLDHAFSQNAPICRIIFGSIDGDGNYLIRVRDDGEKQKHLVHFVIDGKDLFEIIDFHQADEFSLEESLEAAEKARLEAEEKARLEEEEVSLETKEES